MNLENLNKETLNIDSSLTALIARMDEHDRYRTRELMFSLVPAMAKIASDTPSVVGPDEIVESALAVAVQSYAHAALAGL